MGYTEIELEKFESVKKYLSNLSESTKPINLFTLNSFIKWVRVNGINFAQATPDDLINYQMDAKTNRETYEILDNLVIPWVNDTPGRVGYKLRNYATIRGFFKRNRAALPSDPDFNIKGDKPKTTGTLTINEVKDIIQNSDPKFKAAYLIILQGGMDSAAFEYFNTHGLDSTLEQLRHNQEVIRVDLPGRKKARNRQPFYTYFGGDAIDALRTYLKTVDTQTDVVFLNDYGNPLSRDNVQTYWLRLLKRRGFIEPKKDGPGTRYGKNLHEVRDVFRTQWQKAQDRPAPEVAEFIMGHGSSDPNEYNKFYRDEEYVKGEYLKALPMLQIMSSGEPFGLVEKRDLERKTKDQDEKIQSLEDKVDQLTKSLEIIYNQSKGKRLTQ